MSTLKKHDKEEAREGLAYLTLPEVVSRTAGPGSEIRVLRMLPKV